MTSYIRHDLIVRLGTMLTVVVCLVLTSFIPGKENASLTLHFINMANGKPIVLVDSVYTNTLGEPYTVTKLRYYITNIEIPGNPHLRQESHYQIVDLSKKTSFTMPVKKGKYNHIKFLLGVDSGHNVSGAQTGALDPMNDMFWTWNSGYVMFKLEGYSDSSMAPNNKIEHHIGGYRQGNNVATPVSISFDEIEAGPDKPADVFIYVNLDMYWNGLNEIKISREPLITLPGELAKKAAANFAGLFSVKKPGQ